MKQINLFLIIIFCSTSAFSQTSIYGKITDEKTGEELIYTNIIITKNGVFVAGASSDFEGNYSIPVDEGTYEMKISYIGYLNRIITDVSVLTNQGTKLNIQMSTKVHKEIIIKGYENMHKGNPPNKSDTLSAQDKNLPTRKITAGLSQVEQGDQGDQGDQVIIRGKCGQQAIDYYIDGIRVSATGNLIPQSEIDSLQKIILGGTPATGTVIDTTKNN